MWISFQGAISNAISVLSACGRVVIFCGKQFYKLWVHVMRYNVISFRILTKTAQSYGVNGVILIFLFIVNVFYVIVILQFVLLCCQSRFYTWFNWFPSIYNPKCMTKRSNCNWKWEQGGMFIWHPQKFRTFWPPPTLIAFGTDIWYKVHKASLTSSHFCVPPPPSQCERHMYWGEVFLGKEVCETRRRERGNARGGTIEKREISRTSLPINMQEKTRLRCVILSPRGQTEKAIRDLRVYRVEHLWFNLKFISEHAPKCKMEKRLTNYYVFFFILHMCFIDIKRITVS